MNPEDIEYEPASVKAVLAEMEDTAELLIDLSYPIVLHTNDDLAAEVLDLEERMDILQLQVRMSLMTAARSPEDAEELAPVFGVVGVAEKISDAASDIVEIVIEDIGLPDAIRAVLPEAVETTTWCELIDESPYAGRNLGDTNTETKTGARAAVIHRAGEWVMNLDHETTLHAGDVLLLRGRNDGLHTVHEAATGLRYGSSDVPEPTIKDFRRVVDFIVLMKDMSELAVDLAYNAVLSDSEGAAEEVEEFEAEMDAFKSRLEAWALCTASCVEDPVSPRGSVQLVGATEMIFDTALETAENVLRGTDARPVVAAAVRESDEVIICLRVAFASDLAEVTLGDRRVKSETGMRVIAARRVGGREQVASSGSETRLHGGDLIITKGTCAGAERLGELVGDKHKFDEQADPDLTHPGTELPRPST